MKTGASLALICVGAILAFAVTVSTPVFNLRTAGWVLILVGLIGLVIRRSGYGLLGRRLLVRRTRRWPHADDGEPNERVEQVTVPPYYARTPDMARQRAGLPPASKLLNDDTGQGPVRPASERDAEDPDIVEVTEDLYEQ